MTQNKVAFVFPAFAIGYREDQNLLQPGFSEILKSLIRDASQCIDPQLDQFHPTACNFLDDELRNQYMAYIYGCAISGFLHERNINPHFLSGLSMGIYAALKESGAISFTDGLFLIRKAFLEIEVVTRGQEYTMGNVIGLNESDIRNLLERSDPSTQITNQMAEFAFILSGKRLSIEKVLRLAKDEGAFHTRILNTEKPYHSAFLEKTNVRFEPFVRSLDIKNPSLPVLSVIDQSQLLSAEQVVKEITRNLYLPFNWYQTQLRLQKMGVWYFYECGSSQNLAKNAKFISGSSVFLSLNSYPS